MRFAQITRTAAGFGAGKGHASAGVARDSECIADVAFRSSRSSCRAKSKGPPQLRGRALRSSFPQEITTEPSARAPGRVRVPAKESVPGHADRWSPAAYRWRRSADRRQRTPRTSRPETAEGRTRCRPSHPRSCRPIQRRVGADHWDRRSSKLLSKSALTLRTRKGEELFPGRRASSGTRVGTNEAPPTLTTSGNSLPISASYFHQPTSDLWIERWPPPHETCAPDIRSGRAVALHR
jgi:hypothetical protein